MIVQKVNMHIIMSGLYSSSFASYIPNVTFNRIYVTTSYSKSSQMGCNNDRRRLVPPLPPVVQPVEKKDRNKETKN